MRLHDGVQAVVDAYFEAVDDEGPGLVEGLYAFAEMVIADAKRQFGP